LKQLQPYETKQKLPATAGHMFSLFFQIFATFTLLCRLFLIKKAPKIPAPFGPY
jgi:hypothetical protein